MPQVCYTSVSRGLRIFLANEVLNTYISYNPYNIQWFCPLTDPLEYDYTPRLFHLSSASGMFLANEVLNTYRSEEHVVPYPFFQSDIYNVHQPGKCQLDLKVYPVVFSCQGTRLGNKDVTTRVIVLQFFIVFFPWSIVFCTILYENQGLFASQQE